MLGVLELEEVRFEMQMVKITFNDENVEAEAIVALGRRIRVYCLPGGIYEIPASSTALLDELGFSYRIVATEGFDELVRTVRNSVAA